MAQRDSGMPGYLHRREVYARLAKQLLGDNLGTDMLNPFSIEDALLKQVNLGNLMLTDLYEHNFAAPTIAAGANAGTSPPSPVLSAGSTDGRGGITFGTGTTPAAGIMVTITFGQPLPAGRVPYVSLDPNNAATAPLATYIANASNTGFSIALASAPAASQANTVYAIHYTVS